jgi:hypothetical protein
MEAKRQDQERATLFGIFFVAGLVLAMLTASGCSLRVETGWHGQTGRDDRIQTQLVRGEEARERKY